MRKKEILFVAMLFTFIWGYAGNYAPKGGDTNQNPLGSSLEINFDGEAESVHRYVTDEKGVEFIIETTDKWCTAKKDPANEHQIIIYAEKNATKKQRKATVSVEIKKNGKRITDEPIEILVSQASYPQYRHLGKGYDATGEYAVEGNDLKAQVFDHKKLEAKKQIAEIILPKLWKEHSEEGKNLSEYTKEMNDKAKIDGNYKGFTASITGSFSKEEYTSTENSFGRMRGAAEMQIIKLNENLNAESLKASMTDDAAKDINGEWPPIDVIKKYGTHVITGLVMGARVDYTMSSDLKTSSETINWGLAIKGGYKSLAYGIEVGNEYNQFNKVKTETSNYSHNMVVRGGDAMQLSDLIAKGDKNKWAESLKSPESWVMIDYAGNGLLPIWELATDKARQDTLKVVAKKYATQRAENTAQKSSHVKTTIKPKILYNMANYKPYEYAYFTYNMTFRLNGKEIGNDKKNKLTAANYNPKKGAQAVGIAGVEIPFEQSKYKKGELVISISDGIATRGANKDYFKGVMTLKYDIESNSWKVENNKVAGNIYTMDCMERDNGNKHVARFEIEVVNQNPTGN